MPGEAPKWRSVPAFDLLEKIHANQDLTDLLEPCQAIYVWKRRFCPTKAVAESKEKLEAWIEKYSRTPIALIEDRRVTHYASLRAFEISSEGLSERKKETLRKLLSVPAGRRLVSSFIASLEAFAPPIYVGETADLHRRVRDHILGNTDLEYYIHSKLKIDWSYIDFCYFRVGKSESESESNESAERRRQLLETIATQFVLAPFIKRVG